MGKNKNTNYTYGIFLADLRSQGGGHIYGTVGALHHVSWR